VGIGEIGVLAYLAQYAISLFVGHACVDHVLNAFQPSVILGFTPNVLGRVVVTYLLAVVSLQMTAML
jgi:predicted RecB family endonuclease